jgi:KDO2-lipid IV(A) lauroyltransferase
LGKHEGWPSTPDSPIRFRDRILLGLLSALSYAFERLSIDSAVALGARFGDAWHWLGGPRTRRVREQMEFALPEYDVSEREGWAREVFVHLGRGLAELVLLRGRQRAALLERVEIEGFENLEEAERQTPSGGVLIVTAHFGNWELACAKAAARGIPISVVYRGLHQPALDSAMLGLRGLALESSGEQAILEQIPMGRAGLRIIRALDAGRKVVVLLDQDARREEGVFVSFFGHSASTRSGALALAALRGVPVVPVFVRRAADGRTHRFQFHPALQLAPGATDDEEVLRQHVQQVTAAIEKEIRASPGQWIWTHRRWRTQPAVAERSVAAD